MAYRCSLGKSYVVYKYTNRINGNVYVGQTCQVIQKRAGKDGRGYKTCTAFYEAIQSYGWNNFELDILAYNLTKSEADMMERYYIYSFHSNETCHGYNIESGGVAGFSHGDSTKSVISDKAKCRYVKKENNPMFGKKHSEESREKMRNSSRHLSGVNNPNYGNKYSAERRQKMSETAKAFYRNNPEIAKEMIERASNYLRENKVAQKSVMRIEDSKIWQSVTLAAADIGVSVSTLSGHLNGSQKTCKGAHFVFCE